MVEIEFDDKDDKVKKGPHPDWERNYATAGVLIEMHGSSLPEGMSLSLDKFRLMLAFQSPWTPTYATPISLHQDMLSFNPLMRHKFEFYKTQAALINQKAQERGL